MPNREIAAALSLSPDTVKDHLRRIYTKLGVETRLHAEGGTAHRPVRYASEPI
jgi:DNA-binding CsgD family transcriptional regulator